MTPCKAARLVVKVDERVPVAVVVMSVHAIIAEVPIEEVKRIYEQISRMEDHLRMGVETNEP